MTACCHVFENLKTKPVVRWHCLTSSSSESNEDIRKKREIFKDAWKEKAPWPRLQGVDLPDHVQAELPASWLEYKAANGMYCMLCTKWNYKVPWAVRLDHVKCIINFFVLILLCATLILCVRVRLISAHEMVHHFIFVCTQLFNNYCELMTQLWINLSDYLLIKNPGVNTGCDHWVGSVCHLLATMKVLHIYWLC